MPPTGTFRLTRGLETGRGGWPPSPGQHPPVNCPRPLPPAPSRVLQLLHVLRVQDNDRDRAALHTGYLHRAPIAVQLE